MKSCAHLRLVTIQTPNKIVIDVADDEGQSDEGIPTSSPNWWNGAAAPMLGVAWILAQLWQFCGKTLLEYFEMFVNQ